MKWIKTDKQLPEPGVLVHAYSDGDYFHLKYHKDGYWVDIDDWPSATPKAWHYLEPPEDN